MNTRDNHPSDSSNETSNQEWESYGTKSYRPEKIYEPTKATEEDKQCYKDIIISGPLYFDSRRNMYYYRRGNGNLLADDTVDSPSVQQDESDDNHHFCRIL